MHFRHAQHNYMEVEVVYAAPTQQTVLAIDVPAQTTIAEAIQISGIMGLHPEIILHADLPVGIFGKQRSLDWQLKAGDRVEIYRALRMDPKEARLEKAKLQAKRKRIARQEAKSKR